MREREGGRERERKTERERERERERDRERQREREREREKTGSVKQEKVERCIQSYEREIRKPKRCSRKRRPLIV